MLLLLHTRRVQLSLTIGEHNETPLVTSVFDQEEGCPVFVPAFEEEDIE